jgi:hypothetical protein
MKSVVYEHFDAPRPGLRKAFRQPTDGAAEWLSESALTARSRITLFQSAAVSRYTSPPTVGAEFVERE